MTSRIALLSPSAYVRPLVRPMEGQQGATHGALLQINGKVQRYFIKCYGHHTKPLFNEIAGFVLASYTALPQPQHAALIALPGALLHSIFPMHDFASAQHWACWATRAITGQDESIQPTATTYFSQNIRAIVHDLQRWKQLPLLLAFDEWAANVDRNTGNLVRVAEGKYALIDHGSILTGPDWTAELLAPAASYANKLWSLLRSTRGFPLDISSGSALAAKSFVDAYLEARDEINMLGHELIDAADLTAGDHFLRQRSLDVGKYLTHRTGVLV